MATMTNMKALLHKAFKAKDAAEVEELAKELQPEGGDTPVGGSHVHVHLPSSGGAAPGEKQDDKSMRKDATPSTATGTGSMEERMTALETMMKQMLAAVQGGETGMNDRRMGDKRRDGESEEEFKKRMSDKRRDGESEEEFKKRMDSADRARDDETIEGALEMESPPGTEDKARKSKDSSYLVDAYQTLVSQIEIVTPGARVPTFDSADRPAVSYTKICGMRTETLQRAYETRPDLATIMDQINGGRRPDFRKMTCDSARGMLGTIALEAARKNNTGSTGYQTVMARAGTMAGGGVRGKITSPAELNKLSREIYKS